MKKGLVLIIIFSGGIMWGGNNLFENPTFKNNAAGWNNWGKRKGMIVTSLPQGGVVLKCDKPGLNQGIAQYVQLKSGFKYEYSCRIKGTLPKGSFISTLSVYTKGYRKCFRTIAGNFEWDNHKFIFSVPKKITQKLTFRPIVLHGPGEITISSVVLHEIGVSDLPKAKKVTVKMPVIKPVIHPKQKINLSNAKPVNLRAQINEKPSKLPKNASIEKKGSAFIINYAFNTAGHDAIMFDIKKKIPSCLKVSMDLSSDGKGHELFFAITDNGNETHYVINPIKLNFKGKKHIVQILKMPRPMPYNIYDQKWGGDGNQQIDLPVKCLTIGINDKPDSSKGQGKIIIDNLQIGNW